ncbi:MAG: acylphosphatase [Rhodomicrobiaceae bacterium]
MTGSGRTVQLRIRGQVQGVYYRAWTAEQAKRRGLRGWVKNRPDGSVEVLLHGAPEDVAEMIALLWEGPPDARVSGVDIIHEGGAAPSGFAVLR